MIGRNGRVRLETARTEARLTQSEIARLMKLSQNTVLDWEKGRRKPRTDQLELYCAICGCKPEDIYFD